MIEYDPSYIFPQMVSSIMKLVVLGSGTSVPHARRAAAGFWLQTTTGSLLLDASADIAHRSAQERLDWPNLDSIWISHFHLDHLGGLAPFLFGVRWAPQTQRRRKELSIFGPHGLRRILETFDAAGEYKLLDQPFPLQLFEVEPNQQFEILPDIFARTFSTPHTPESMAIRISERDGNSIVYTSDTGLSEELIDFCGAASVLLLECSFHRGKPVKTHLELSEAMEIARVSAPERLVLTHLYPEWDEVDIVAEAKKLWPGETIEAFDGLHLEF